MAEDKTEAQLLLDSRREVYGDRIDNMVRTAKIWSGLTGFEIQPWHVPLMMSAYKMFRAMTTPDYSDNIDDVDGWNLMFREVVGDGMINARTVEEYLEEKFRRVREEATFQMHPVNTPTSYGQGDGALLDGYK
jgi:hypothetical protein